MKIIKTTTNENGSRPALQDWWLEEPPSGYAWCPDEFISVFYSTCPAGFVNIEIERDTVVGMTVNEEALAEYVANLPEPTKPVIKPTTDEILDTLLGVTSDE